jgi:hypothetical protein
VRYAVLYRKRAMGANLYAKATLNAAARTNFSNVLAMLGVVAGYIHLCVLGQALNGIFWAANYAIAALCAKPLVNYRNPAVKLNRMKGAGGYAFTLANTARQARLVAARQKLCRLAISIALVFVFILTIMPAAARVNDNRFFAQLLVSAKHL